MCDDPSVAPALLIMGSIAGAFAFGWWIGAMK